jgi:hypothetical protein
MVKHQNPRALQPHGKVRTIKRNDLGKNDGRGRSRACRQFRLATAAYEKVTDV